MTDQNTADNRDAFKEIMAAARTEAGRLEMAHQSLGRKLSEGELALADALMVIYGDGISDQAAVAEALASRKVKMPSGATTGWTAESLKAELQVLNEELDFLTSENSRGA